MSGYPNKQDITLLRSLLLSLKAEDDAISRATAAKAQAETQIADAHDRMSTYQQQIAELMHRMNCASPGNTGYSNRLLALLTELAEQAK